MKSTKGMDKLKAMMMGGSMPMGTPNKAMTNAPSKAMMNVPSKVKVTTKAKAKPTSKVKKGKKK